MKAGYVFHLKNTLEDAQYNEIKDVIPPKIAV